MSVQVTISGDFQFDNSGGEFLDCEDLELKLSNDCDSKYLTLAFTGNNISTHDGKIFIAVEDLLNAIELLKNNRK